MFNGALNPTKLKHNPEIIKKLFKNKGDSIVATDDFYIIFPERYINKNLAVMGGTVKLLSVYAVVDKNMNYGVVMAPVFMEITPMNVTSVIVNGIVNKVLEINKGDPFVLNRNLLKVEGFMYDLFDEFFLQGKVPWYVTYTKLSELFLESYKYAGSRIGNDPLTMELITSITARSSTDKLVSYREIVKNPKTKLTPEYVGLNNVYYSYDNTLSKIMGGYMSVGITTAIVNKEEETTKVSALLRA